MHNNPNNQIHYRLHDKCCANKHSHESCCTDLIIPAALGAAFVLGIAVCCLVSQSCMQPKHHCHCK